MQSAMNRLAGFVRTRRKLVLVLWVALLAASVPFASQQTKHLTSGGFEVPGTGSAEVDKEIKRFTGQRAGDARARAPGQGRREQLVAAVDRASAAAKAIDHVELQPEAAEAAKQAAANQDVIVVPLVVDGIVDDILQASKDLRAELKIDEVEDGVQTYVVGQQALWAGMQQIQQEHSRRPRRPASR